MNTNARGIHESPGIYTREIDVSSYSSKSIGATTLGLVGETLIGPAFQPIPISTYKEFQTYFGGTSPEKYANGYPKYELGYIAKSYLQQSQQLYVTRVLGLSGYLYNNLFGLYIQSGSTKSLFAVLRSKAEYIGENLTPYVDGIQLSISTITGTSQNFDIVTTLNGATGETYNVSLNQLKKNYILNVLGATVKSSTTSDIFIEELYEGVLDSYKNGDDFRSGLTIGYVSSTDFNDYRDHFRYASTPWFVSEVKGNKVIPLFRFLTLSDGENANNMFKITIKNIDPATLKFDVQIRAIYDNDTKPVVLEQFNNCTLDPSDGNYYIGAQIGTSDEVYKLKSKYVVIDINDDDKVIDSVPMGFQGYPTKNIAGVEVPNLIYNNTYEDNGFNVDKKYCFGISNKTGVDMDAFSYKGLNATGITNGFHIEPTSPSGYTKLDISTYNLAINDKKLMKFTSYFAGGFDGWDIFRTNRTNVDDYQYNKYISATGIGKDVVLDSLTSPFKKIGNLEFSSNYGIPDVPVSNAINSDFYAFWSASRAYADPELVDINILATPGIDWKNNSILTYEILDMVESERKDSLYILTTPDKDINSDDSKSSMFTPEYITDQLNGSFDSNYAASYYPWCQYYDPENGVYLYLPPTRDVVRNIAYTDNTAYAWFPPAGIGRGNVDCVKAKKSLKLDEEDLIISNRLNVIKTFALDGVKIWGQKTLQVDDTALNRIGVRRMMLYLRKTVRRSNLPLIFEPNDNTTKNTFLEIVNPILNYVKTNRGLSEYKILIDDSTEAKARHEMNVQIWIKPIGALEFINIDFMITSEGFDFANI